VEVTLGGLPPVVIEDIQPDLQTAIDRATGRAGRTVARRLEVPLTRRRMPGRRSGASSEPSG
jgi:hypothetical protein